VQAEYLFLNLFILAGPVIFSFDREVRYVRHWPRALAAAGMAMIPFILWDTAVSGVHWYFNERFTLPFRLMGLPPGEWLFFITVPFACLFIWQIIVIRRPARAAVQPVWIAVTAMLLVPAAGILILHHRIYAAIVCFFLIWNVFLDHVLNTHLLREGRTFLYMAIITGLILIFNGYLTSRPVIVYNPEFILNLRIWTIPVEDFGYGYSLILLCTILYEKLRGKHHA